MCVQRFDDSLNSAIHITYRISLRSSSMPEPRDPLLKVLLQFFSCLWFRRFVGQLFGKESSGGRLCGFDPRARGAGGEVRRPFAAEATVWVHKGV